ncbi:hypothetical protein DFH29DRAFT_948695 [Suillus ampliporus]|nr:hypothetical protein DFH29DRAFT_948695 [Suillus ampliporus]
MVSPVQDWGLIDESHRETLKNDIPRVRGGRLEYTHLNATLDTLLEIKRVATQSQVHVFGLGNTIELYFDAIGQGKQLRAQGWLKRLWNARNWNDSKDRWKLDCAAVCHLARKTSSAVHAKVDRGPSPAFARRRRSFEEILHAPHERQNQHNILSISTPVRAAQSLSETATTSANTNAFREEDTVQHTADMAARQSNLSPHHGRAAIDPSSTEADGNSPDDDDTYTSADDYSIATLSR